jgi:hypothetical protein
MNGGFDCFDYLIVRWMDRNKQFRYVNDKGYHFRNCENTNTKCHFVSVRVNGLDRPYGRTTICK